jgi:hypothetical protein
VLVVEGPELVTERGELVSEYVDASQGLVEGTYPLALPLKNPDMPIPADDS